MNWRPAKENRGHPRPRLPVVWFDVLLALCVLVAAAELLWGEEIVNWLERGRIARARANIIASYCRAAEAGSLPRPADANAFEVYRPAKDAPYRMALRVRTESGETRHFLLVRPPDEAGTDWGFHPK